MDEFTREVATLLAAGAEDDAPRAGLAADILHHARRRRARQRIGTAMACLLVLATGTAATAALTRWWTAGAGNEPAAAPGPLVRIIGDTSSREYRLPPGAQVVGLAENGEALAVTRDGGTRILWFVRPDGTRVRLDQAGTDLAGWTTDGTVTAWIWKGAAPDAGWRCTDRPGRTPVSLGIPGPAYGSLYADHGHLVWTDGRVSAPAHLLTGCGHAVDVPVQGRVFGLRWPYALVQDNQGRAHQVHVPDGADTALAFSWPPMRINGGFNILPEVTAVGPQGLLAVEPGWPAGSGAQSAASWQFTGAAPNRAPRKLAGSVPIPPRTDYLREASAGTSLLAITIPTPTPRSQVYDPATGRNVLVDGRVFVAGDLLLHEEPGGYRLYTLKP